MEFDFEKIKDVHRYCFSHYVEHESLGILIAEYEKLKKKYELEKVTEPPHCREILIDRLKKLELYDNLGFEIGEEEAFLIGVQLACELKNARGIIKYLEAKYSSKNDIEIPILNFKFQF